MKSIIRSATSVAIISTSGMLGTASPVDAYPIDCAILLCLAGGWPASAPCAAARAEFIHRITPWPIEPPLQIWRCPMAISFDDPAAPSSVARLYDIAYRPNTLLAPQSPPATDAIPVQVGDQADIDISGAEFDFVRSIRVFHIEVRQHRQDDGGCTESDETRLGVYGAQGEFRWTESSAVAVPSASELRLSEHCQDYAYQSVFVDWRNQAGTYGFEEVRY